MINKVMENRYISLQRQHSGAARYVDDLDKLGQIDRDSNGEPFVLSFEAVPGETNLVRVYIKRNNSKQNFVINKRSRSGKPTRMSFDIEDGFKRDDSKPVQQKSAKTENADKSRGERSRRVGVDYEDVIKSLLARDE